MTLFPSSAFHTTPFLSHFTMSSPTSSSSPSTYTTMMPSSSTTTITMTSSAVTQLLPPFFPPTYAGNKRTASCDAPHTPSSKRHRHSGAFRPRISPPPNGARKDGAALEQQRYSLPATFCLGKRDREIDDDAAPGPKARITSGMNVQILTKIEVSQTNKPKLSVSASPRHLKPCSPRLPIFLRRSIRRQNKSTFRLNLRQPETKPAAKVEPEPIPSLSEDQSSSIVVKEEADPIVESKEEEQLKPKDTEEVMQIVSSPEASELASPKPIEVESEPEVKAKVESESESDVEAKAEVVKPKIKKEKEHSIIGTLKNFKKRVAKASQKMFGTKKSDDKKKSSKASSEEKEVEKKKSDDRIEEETEDDDDAKTIVPKKSRKSSLRLRISSKKKDVRDIFSSDEKEPEEPKKSSTRRVTPVAVPASPTDAVMKDSVDESEKETDKAEEAEEKPKKKKKKRSTRKTEEEEDKPKKKKKKKVVVEKVESETEETEKDESEDKKPSSEADSDSSSASIKDVDMLSPETISDAKEDDEDKSDALSVMSMDIDVAKSTTEEVEEDDDDDSKTIRGKESDAESELSKTDVVDDSSKSSETSADEETVEEADKADKKDKDDEDSTADSSKSESDEKEKESPEIKIIVDEKPDNTPHSPTRPRLSISIQVVPAHQAPSDVLTPPPTPPLGSPKVSDAPHHLIAWSANFSTEELDETLDNIAIQSWSEKTGPNGKSLRSRLSRIFSQTLKRDNCDHFNPLNISRHAYRDSFARDREDDEETEFDDAMSFKTIVLPPSPGFVGDFVPFQAPMESCVERLGQFTMA